MPRHRDLPASDSRQDSAVEAIFSDGVASAATNGAGSPKWPGFSIGRGATWMVLLTTVASGVNYASNLIFSRLLSPESYGDLNALFAFSVIAAVPTGAAQTLVAERIAVMMAEGRYDRVRYLIRYASAHIALVAIVGGAVYTLAIPLVYEVLNLQAIGPAIALAPLLVFAFFTPVACGVLQGMDRFVALGLVLLAVAVSRIALGVPWTLAGGGAGGPIAGQAIGSVLALVGVGLLLRPFLLRRGTGAATSGLRRKLDRRTISAGGAFVAFAVLSNLDLLMAKLLLSPKEAGFYAALATIEKIVIFLPGAVAIVMVPSAARAMHSSGSAARVLRVAALLVLATTALAAAPAIIEPTRVIQLMFGDDYTGISQGVLPIVLAGAGLAMLYLLVVYTVAIQDRRWFILLLTGVVLQIAAISTFHSSPAAVATAQAVTIGVVLLVNEIVFHPVLRTRRVVAEAKHR